MSNDDKLLRLSAPFEKEHRPTDAPTLTAAPKGSVLGFLAGGGTMGALIRSKNWSETPLGRPEYWPQSLRTSVSTCLNCSFPILIWWGRDLVKIYNDAYAEIIAEKHPRALGMPGREVWPEIWDTIGPLLGRVIDRGEAVPADDMLLRLERRRGFAEECYFSFSYSPIRDEIGNIVGVFCPVIETTKRVFAERRSRFLLGLEAALRDLSDAGQVKYTASRALGEHLGVAQAGYAEVMPGGKQVLVEDDWNDGRIPSVAGVHKLDDYGPEALAELLAGRCVSIADASKDPRTCNPPILAAYQSLQIRSLLDVPLTRGGALASVFFLHDPGPRPWTDQEVNYAQEVAERIWSAVERVRAEMALRRSEEDFRRLSDNLPSLCWMADQDGKIYWFNRRCCEFSGMSQDELVAGAWQQLHDPALLPEVMERWECSICTGIPFEMIFPLRRFDGVMCPFLTRVVPLRLSDGTISHWFGTNVDITEQRTVEERLLASEAKLRELNETLEQQVGDRTADRDRIWRLSTDIMLVARFGGTITAANPAWRRVLGWSEDELLGNSFLDLVHPADLEKTIRAAQGLAAGETMLGFENRYRTSTGGYRWLSWTAVPDEQFIHAVGRDVSTEKEAATQLEAAQERLRQAQRMEALGQLAGGIAHDFNNVLQVVTSGLRLIQSRATDANAIRQVAEMVQSAADRGTAVTSRLLAFARKDELVAVAVPTGDLLEGIREVLIHTLGRSITVRTKWDTHTPSILVDKAQLETVLVNLAVNARDAMPDGGELTISAAADTVTGLDSQGPSPGDYVRLSVTDTGTGMNAATLARASEPFFTTKPLAQGTGLGLAMARGFAEQSRGGFAISSTLRVGTTVTLWFPCALATSHSSVVQAGKAIGEAPTIRALIMLVDDEPLVRGVLAAQLEDAGYVVIPAVDGLDALSRLDAGATPDVLISDYAMPGMNGLVLAREARRRMAALPIALITGYADPDLLSGLDELPGGAVVLLRKPVSVAELDTVARTLLDSAAAIPN